MKTVLTILLLCLFLSENICAQTIHGQFLELAGSSIRLEGFDGLRTYPISTVVVSEDGNFTAHYTSADYGVGYLISDDSKPIYIILNGENIEIKGETLNRHETIRIIKGEENQWFEKYAIEQPKREQALSAWVYLENLYKSEPVFNSHSKTLDAIRTEKQRIRDEEKAFLASLPQKSYIRWFLPVRKLVSSVPIIAQYRTEEIPDAIAAFRNLDYTDVRLYKSGLFKDAIDNHFWLLENSGKPIDSIFFEMKISIDYMLEHLVKDEKKLNEVGEYLFDLLEKHSLFIPAEHLAIKLLNNDNCKIDTGLAKQFESYRAMKIGNTAPDITFIKENFANPKQEIKNLSDIKTTYTLLLFGASWCPKCNKEISEIITLYPKWKKAGVELVYIALEEDRKQFIQYASTFQFPTYTNAQKWNCEIADNYYVFSTPTLFLLNNKREIILRPSSIKQVDAWIDWYIK